MEDTLAIQSSMLIGEGMLRVYFVSGIISIPQYVFFVVIHILRRHLDTCIFMEIYVSQTDTIIGTPVAKEFQSEAVPNSLVC